MEYFNLRGRKIFINSPASVRRSSNYEVAQCGMRLDDIVTVYGVILAKKTRRSPVQEPYIYIEQNPQSAAGIWLRGVDYQVIEEPAPPSLRAIS